jgi:hypothetical protein
MVFYRTCRENGCHKPVGLGHDFCPAHIRRCQKYQCDKPTSLGCNFCPFHEEEEFNKFTLEVHPISTLQRRVKTQEAVLELPAINQKTFGKQLQRSQKLKAVRLEEKKRASREHRATLVHQAQKKRERELLQLRRSLVRKMRRTGRIEKVFADFDINGTVGCLFLCVAAVQNIVFHLGDGCIQF